MFPGGLDATAGWRLRGCAEVRYKEHIAIASALACDDVYFYFIFYFFETKKIPTKESKKK
jgi:hypothetical protein